MENQESKFNEESRRILHEAMDGVYEAHGREVAICVSMGVMAVLTGLEVRRGGCNDQALFLLCEFHGNVMTELCRALDVSAGECQEIADKIIETIAEMNRSMQQKQQQQQAAPEQE